MSDTYDAKNGKRNMWGCIVTLVNMATEEKRTFHFAGFRKDGALRAAAICDELGSAWRVTSYSTPLTILADMDGTRAQSDARHPGSVECPEVNIFAQLGRRDLIHPRLVQHAKKQRP